MHWTQWMIPAALLLLATAFWLWRLERERQRERTGRRISEETARSILNTAADGVIIIDEVGVMQSVNPAAERLFGYTAAEMVGRNVSLLMPSPDRERHDGYLARYRETGQRRIIGIGREVVGRRKDGSVFPLYLSVGELHAEGKRLFTGIVHDLTKLKETEAELRQAKEAAEAANQSKDRFLAMLSHELRTPLTPVLVATSAWGEGRLADEDMPATLAMIRRNVELQARLIDDLLDLTRIERGKIELHRRTVDVHRLIAEALETFGAEAATKRLEWSRELNAAEHYVSADPVRLQQVLWNLLKNALKFTPDGGRVTVRTRNETRSSGRPILVIEVRDTGMGIEPAMLSRIFNAFEQGGAQTTRKFGGLGLGLAIGRALVEAHGGSLDAASEGPRQGAAFTIRLETIDAPASAGVAEALPAAPAAHRTARILLVEDHADTQRILSKLLERMGYQVRGASSLEEAVNAASGGNFDLIISDLALPDGSGLELPARLPRPIAAIALSGYGMESDIARSRAAGFREHIVKPIDLGHLRRTIDAALANGQS